MTLPAIRPPRGTAFLGRFTHLDPADEDQIQEFADRYGSLVNPLGDPLELWRREIGEGHDLAGTLDEAADLDPESRDRPIRQVFAALSSRFTVRTREETLADDPQKTACIRHAALSRRALGQRFDDWMVVYTYGQRTVPFDPAAATKLGYREPGQITASQDNKATEAFVRFARICVQEAIEQRLWGAHTGIVYDYAGRSAQPPRIVPATLLGALYLELDRKLRTKSRRHLERPLQRCAWAPCPNWLEPTRTTKVYCSNTCVQRAKRQRQQEAQSA